MNLSWRSDFTSSSPFLYMLGRKIASRALGMVTEVKEESVADMLQMSHAEWRRP